MTGHNLYWKKPVLVLGMHRSGTSCLMGCLEEAGLAIGEVNRKAPHNRKGNNENQKIMLLHDDILAHNAGSWDEPPEQTVWLDEHRRRRDELLDEYMLLPGYVFGFKDPRTLFVMDGWLEVFEECRMVGTFRHPVTVAQSLAKRDQFSVEKSFRLWMQYNQALLKYQKRYGFCLISFDLPQQEYQFRVSQVAQALGLRQAGAGCSFYDAGLRNQRATESDECPQQVLDLYQSLQEIGS